MFVECLFDDLFTFVIGFCGVDYVDVQVQSLVHDLYGLFWIGFVGLVVDLDFVFGVDFYGVEVDF